MKQCSNCHAQYDDTKTYCGNCGKPLFVVQEQVQPVPQPVPQPAPQPVPPPAPQPIPQPIPQQPVSQPVPQSLQQPPAKKKIQIKLILILSFLCLSLIGNAIMGGILYVAYTTITDQTEDMSSLRDENYELTAINNFYDDYVRIVPDDGSGKYHRYTCRKLDKDARFWIYNVDAAEDIAYPCQYCCEDD